MPIHKWKAMNAFKTRETMLAGAGQGELQAAEASLRVPLRIICIPLFNWIYAKVRERRVGPEVGPTSAFFSCIPTGMNGPTRICWADLTLFSLKANVR